MPRSGARGDSDFLPREQNVHSTRHRVCRYRRARDVAIAPATASRTDSRNGSRQCAPPWEKRRDLSRPPHVADVNAKRRLCDFEDRPVDKDIRRFRAQSRPRRYSHRSRMVRAAIFRYANPRGRRLGDAYAAANGAPRPHPT